MIRRIYLISAALIAGGTLVAVTAGGSAAVVGFLLGAGYSILSFRFLHRVVESIGTEHPRKVSGFFMAIRFLVVAGMLYVIIKYLQTSLIAALWGLFVAIAAVILESVYQLYARTP